VQSISRTDAPRALLAWPEVDTVLLDMDGTLLDLRFDNFFWLEAVPERYARNRGLTLERSKEILAPMFAAKQGTLDWYCVDYWTRELEIDIAALKAEFREHVGFLPGAETFLQALRASGLRTVLVTNAHPSSLRIKAERTGLLQYFDATVSSHRYGAPKEHPAFWAQLEAELALDPLRTLFIDDSLAVLQAAKHYGIGHIVAIAHPDSTQERRVVQEFASVHSVHELLALPAAPRSENR
jgi:HAD superfamily hydrolase (TIGR01509 family)